MCTIGGVVEAQIDIPIGNPSCRVSSCDDCLSAACAWSDGTCNDSCVLLLGLECYNLERYPGLSGPEICEIEMADTADALICRPLTDCESCTSTTLSDRSATCLWHPFDPLLIGAQGGGFCFVDSNKNCGVVGTSVPPAATACDDASGICSEIESCGDCVESGCEWAAGTC
jgi:hypothetical protein